MYIYMPERNVFRTAPRHILYTVAIYIMVALAFNAIRARTAQAYEMEQHRIQRQYALELEEKNKQLEESIRREEKANAAKSDFLSRMTHDIRTPLNGIIGLLKIDEKHMEDTELINANRKKMSVAANHLLSLINDILQMSKLEDGNIELSNEVVDLRQLVKDVITIVEQRASEAGLILNMTECLIMMSHISINMSMQVHFIYGRYFLIYMVTVLNIIMLAELWKRISDV